MFILSEQRNENVKKAFENYRNYVDENRSRFPESALTLATSDWYFSFALSGCPHDGWLENVSILEPSSGDRQHIRTVEIKIELLAAYHDGLITFHYPKVYSYDLRTRSLEKGHRDWLYDEFRISEAGRLIHEIEWCGIEGTGNWLIEASDVCYEWRPFKDGLSHTNIAL